MDLTLENYDYDMVLINLPRSDLMVPPTAPAVLKGIAESHGFKIKTHDFNVDMHRVICKSNFDHYEELQNYFLSEGPHSQELLDQVDQFYNYVIDWLSQQRTRYIGISVFSVHTHTATFELCNLIKERYPDWKIVLGGKGLSTTPYITFWNHLTGVEKIMHFYQIMMKRNLVHHTIIGDAEDSLIEFLDGKSYSSDSWSLASSANLSYPFSNFDDYDFDGYTGILSRIQLPVISSKGCVRSCDFCDVGAQFSKFQSKDGARLAEEMIYLSKKYNINEFSLADSIANGNMKSLRACLAVLADYNQSLPSDKKISMAGNWIARPPGAIKPEFFDLMATAGFKNVTIGAESGSDYVLEAMDKKTTVGGLFYELEQMQRVRIGSIINNIIGHWAERYSDFLEHVDMILRLGPYIADRTVIAVNLGAGYATLRHTPAADNTEKNKLITSDDNFTLFWYTPINPNLTLKARLARWYIIYNIGRYLKMPLLNRKQHVAYMQVKLQESFDKGRDFIHTHVDKHNYTPCPSIALADTWQQYVDNRIQELFSSTVLQLEVESSSCNGSPRLFVKYNGEMLYHDELPQGHSTVEVAINYNFIDQSLIEIGMDNKNPNDTEVDTQGNIVADKRILLNSVKIDNIDLLKNPNYFYNQVEYIENNAKLSVGRPGFFVNSQINIKFRAPYWLWYVKDQLAGTMEWQTFQNDTQVPTMLEDIKSYIYKYEY
jgi:radical SAM superfamily enzyme YgiQ (UPF0313 family)